MSFFSKMYRVLQTSVMGTPLSSYSGRLPKSGSMLIGDIYEHQTQALPIYANGSSSSDGGGMYPTPMADDAVDRQPSKTPVLTAAGTYRHLNAAGNHSLMKLSQVVKMYPTAEPGERLYLNPDWVEKLMGFPTGWTDISSPQVHAQRSTRTNRRVSRPEKTTVRRACKHSVTRSSRKSSTRLHLPSANGWR